MKMKPLGNYEIKVNHMNGYIHFLQQLVHLIFRIL